MVPDLTLAEAFAVWLDSRSNIKPRTRAACVNNFSHLAPCFGAIKLRQIGLEHIREYRECHRKLGIAPSRIDREIYTLQQILNAAGLWAPLVNCYQPPAVPPKTGGVLNPEEEQHLFRVASRHPRWLAVYCCFVVSCNTNVRPFELRRLRLSDIDLENFAWFRVDHHTNEQNRKRRLRCNSNTAWALRQLVERHRRLIGYLSPDHYLLPRRAARKDDSPDPTRPMSSWRGTWRTLTTEAGQEYPRIAQMRFTLKRRVPRAAITSFSVASLKVVSRSTTKRAPLSTFPFLPV